MPGWSILPTSAQPLFIILSSLLLLMFAWQRSVIVILVKWEAESTRQDRLHTVCVGFNNRRNTFTNGAGGEDYERICDEDARSWSVLSCTTS